MIDFERHGDLDAQVRAALAFHGLEPAAESGFFDPELLGQGADDWRSRGARARRWSSGTRWRRSTLA